MVSRLPLSAGFRMKEILLDLAEVTAGERPEIDEQLVDFGVVGPGPRRALNFVNNRRWFDNEYDRSPQVFWGCHANRRAGHSCTALPLRDFSQAEKLYVDELRAFRTYLQSHTSIAELKALNLLGVQFALCEASKARVLWFGTGRDAQKKATSQYIFFLRYESGSLYKPSTRDLEVSLQPVSAPDAARMGSIWNYWEGESDEEGAPVPDDLHPDHAPAA